MVIPVLLIAAAALFWLWTWIHANRLEVKGPDGKPYLTRWHLWRAGFKVFVHRIHSKDMDRDPHNHPWPFGLALVLWGGYDELRVTKPALYESRLKQSIGLVSGLCGPWHLSPYPDPGTNKWRFSQVRWWNWIGPNVYHRILAVKPNTWTLFLAGPRTREWGFWTEHGHVPYEGPTLED